MIDPTSYSNPTDIQKAIIAARPRIEKVNRIAGWGTMVFGIFNFILGTLLFFSQARFSSGISILNGLLNYQVWGVIFFLSGAVILGAFVKNNWRIMRAMLGLMLILKCIWLMALLLRVFIFGPNNFLLLTLWAALTALQFLLYLFFFPEVPAAERRNHRGRHA